jgi:hypothetical protein
VASRYFLVTLTPVLLAAQLAGLAARRALAWSAWPLVAAGLLAIPAAFIATSPYFLLDLAVVQRDLRSQNMTTHLGADGLSFAGNLAYYVRDGVPALLSTPLALLAGAGALLALRRGHPSAWLLVLTVAAYVVGIALSPLHWARWLIAVLPVLSVLAAAPVVLAARRIPGGLLQPLAATIALAVLSAGPLSAMVRSNVQLAHPSTRIQAREWILANLPPGARIAQEWYTAPLAGSGFAVSESMSLARGKTLDWYRSNGVRYLVTSDAIAGRFLMEPERYSRELEFYGALVREGRLLQEFAPSRARGGPRIGIYELPAPAPAS